MRDAGIIDEEKKVRHTKLALKAAQVIAEPSKIGIKLKVLLGLHFVFFCGDGVPMGDRKSA